MGKNGNEIRHEKRLLAQRSHPQEEERTAASGRSPRGCFSAPKQTVAVRCVLDTSLLYAMPSALSIMPQNNHCCRSLLAASVI